VARPTITRKTKKTVFVRKDTLGHTIDWTPLVTGYDVKLFLNAEDVPFDEWQKLNHTGNVFTDLSYLRGLQHTAPPEMDFVYVILRKNKKIIAGYIFQAIHLSSEVLSDILEPLTKQKSIVAGLSEWLTRCKEEKGMRVLISGNNFVSGEHGVLVAPGADPNEAFEQLSEIVKLVVKTSITPVKISVILVKDYYSAHPERPEELLKKKRYHAFAVEPEMIVSIDASWVDFNAYLLSMSKKYRNRGKTVLKNSAQLVEHHLDEAGIRKNLDVLHVLYMNMHAKARFRLSALTPEYFAEMKRRFPARFGVITYTLNNEIVAFRSFFINENQLEAHFIGVDYELNREFNLYQRILYDFVNDAILTGRTELLLGRTAAEIKSTIGAVPSDLRCYIRHRNSFSNQVIRPFIDYLKPTTWTPRSPFRLDG